MDLGTLVGNTAWLSFVVVSIIEMVKRLLLQPLDAKYNWSQDKYVVVTTAVALFTGWCVAAGAYLMGIPLPIPADFTVTSPWAVVFFAGPMLVFGNAIWHEVLDFIRAKTDQQRNSLPPLLDPPTPAV